MADIIKPTAEISVSNDADANKTPLDEKRVLPPATAEDEERHVYSTKSLGFLALDNPLRMKLIQLIEWKPFDYFILVVILWNSVMLAMTDYSVVSATTFEPSSNGVSTSDMTQPATSLFNLAGESVEIIFSVVFTIECIVKILAMGFISSKGCYLRDSWNILDFTVVMSGLLEVIPGVTGVSALRVIRVLRPLRSLNSNPKLKALVGSLLKSLPPLMDVNIILAFVFMIFGILGTQLWQGTNDRLLLISHDAIFSCAVYSYQCLYTR